ncbi:hypothetical protein STCU_02010 [Strigomonas culicis]|uniref:Uncharacterized protein n=1 Tax=Strigomonas culicis TaxID=28005 RepID=S9W334_9TRYP|nr:hypothetical protein STCU_02010 [Strigomonas culicis]|eukprot:EPY33756.1 hypothetical protein STCU_02010 [Strigomonas culicis]
MLRRRANDHLVVLSARGYTRGMPYAPQGTIQDFTSSPRHTKLAEMQRDLDVRAGRSPTGLYAGPTITTAEGARPLFPNITKDGSSTFRPSMSKGPTRRDFEMPALGDRFQMDMRVDPAYAELPEHVVAAKQSMLTMQSDAYGESIRGVVPPPPPLDPEAPKAYTAPRIQLDTTWWVLMWLFASLFVFLAKVGK